MPYLVGMGVEGDRSSAMAALMSAATLRPIVFAGFPTQ